MAMRTAPLLSAAMILAAAWPSAALGYLDSFETRTVASANGEFLLVLLTPPAERVERAEYDATVDQGLEEEEIRAWRELRARERELEAKYPQSGIYRNDGSTELVWPMPYITVCKNIYLSNDGSHVVAAFLDWDAGNVSSRGNALEFYASGKQIAAYNEGNMVDAFFAKTIANWCLGRGHLTCRDANLDDDEGIFTLVTTQGESLQFDVTTGKACSTLAMGHNLAGYVDRCCKRDALAAAAISFRGSSIGATRRDAQATEWPKIVAETPPLLC